MKSRPTFATAAACLVCIVLSACGERVQTASTHKADARPAEGPAGPYTAAGWRPGDAAGWAQQIRTRQQNQNEYARTGAH